jgi:membrane protease YdiL (CAAX protease family)
VKTDAREEEAPAAGERSAAPGPAAPAPVRGLLAFAVPFYAVVALFALGFALFSDGLGGLLGEAAPTPAGLGVGLAVGLLVVAASRVGSRAWKPMVRAMEALADLLGPIRVRDALLLALLSGTAEELLFRGALWPHLGLVGTTLLFGLVHVLPRRPLWIYPLFATAAGLLLGLLRDGTQSLWPPVVAHVTVNALNLAWLGAVARRRAASA